MWIMVHYTLYVANHDSPTQGKNINKYETLACEYVYPKCISNDIGFVDDLYCVDSI